MEAVIMNAKPKMDDHDFVFAMENMRFPLAEFDHEAHLRLAWIYFRNKPLAEGMIAFRDTLQRCARHHGVTAKYHETITYIFLIVVHDRMTIHPNDGWSSFRSRNPSLFNDWRATLAALYSQDVLDSERAKERFMLPEKWRSILLPT
jgi:hypothetical protein